MKRRKLATGLSLAASMVVLAAVPSGAFAAHCVAPATEPSSPGFSYFGTDHVKGSTHPEGGNPGPHVALDGTRSSGASACRDATGSPSNRAPGKNRS